jgi:hypothetical protein
MRTMQGIRGFFGAAGWERFLTPRTAFGMTNERFFVVLVAG